MREEPVRPSLKANRTTHSSRRQGVLSKERRNIPPINYGFSEGRRSTESAVPSLGLRISLFSSVSLGFVSLSSVAIIK